MSDRTIPRSLRMIEGFGVHTFRLIDAGGKSTFVKFHWRPKLGAASVVWDEAVKICGADPDFHRRDLWEAIDKGDFPEWELSVQAFDQKAADRFDFDVLDATKLIPEEVVPLEPVGKMVLDRNPTNFFAETEQVAFHPGHVVPGIDFSNDPLLQGRLHSYLDTQLSRLGGPNFHEIPINRPKCPMQNFQRDGHMRMAVPTGRVNYEPNSQDPTSPRENPTAGFTSFPEALDGAKVRLRSPSFADHYSQARLFFRSMSPPEQRHIVSAFAFELAKVEAVAIRQRMLGHLAIVDAKLQAGVAEALGMEGQAESIRPAKKPIDLAPSPPLSLVLKARPTLKGRKVAVLVTDGSNPALLAALRAALDKEGAKLVVVGTKIGGFVTKNGDKLPVDHRLSGAPSVLFDAVVVAPSKEGVALLAQEAAAIDWIRDAFGHLKTIGRVDVAGPLFDKAGVVPDDGVVEVSASNVADFIARARKGRHWDREPKLRSPG